MKHPLTQYRRIHFIGIGGSGMSGLARILKEKGCKISGSDQTDSATIASLKKDKIAVSIGHKASFLPAKTGLIIRSLAIPPQNSEMLEAKKRKIPVLTYGEAVGLLSREYETISVCGTHGKTTTTALAAAALIACKKDPSVIVGANVKELNGKNYRTGKGKNLIIESCEHFRSFLNYEPKIIIITNIEADHLDYYKNLEDYIGAFRTFIGKLPKNGLLITNGDDANVRKILKNFTAAKTILYGTAKNNDYRLEKNVVLKKDATTAGRVATKEKKLATLNMKIPGAHNLMNAAAVIALASELNLNVGTAAKALSSYNGSARRFELKGIIGNTHIIDDYAHHPTEIAATLNAIREKFGKESRVLCIFQPHQYSRTRLLLKDFAKSFGDADEVIIPNILRVRDKSDDVKSITPEKLAKEISRFHKNAHHVNGFPKTAAHVKKHLRDYDVVVTMGAGDVWKIADELLK
jgi:UDP-N-acetylmuramate--alanine ligase